MHIPSFACALLVSASPSLAQVTFEVLEAPNGAALFGPRGVDYDGNTITGVVSLPGGTRAAIWVEGVGSSLLPMPSGTPVNILASGISASGKVVVGEYLESGAGRGFRWTPELGSQGLGTLPSFIPVVTATAISADGRVVVGGVTVKPIGPVPLEPYRWTMAGGFDLLDVPGVGNFSMKAKAVDATGIRVGGDVNQIPQGVDGFVYEDGVPVAFLSDTTGSAFHEVSGFSADGSTLVGSATDTSSTSRPILWTAAGGAEDIPFPTSAGTYARFLSVSGNGGVVVGMYAEGGTGQSDVFVWRRGEPTSVSLSNFLVAQGVIASGQYEFSNSPSISTDGRVIAGLTWDLAAGHFVGYRVVLAPAETSSLSTTFCSSQPLNSVGAVATLDAVVTIDASLNALELLATNLPPGRFGYLLASQTPIAGFTPPGSTGNLCLGGTLRSLVITLMLVDASGTVREFIDQDTLPGAMVVTSGSTMNFQGWYRDAGPQSRFTEAASVTFQ